MHPRDNGLKLTAKPTRVAMDELQLKDLQNIEAGGSQWQRCGGDGTHTGRRGEAECKTGKA